MSTPHHRQQHAPRRTGQSAAALVALALALASQTACDNAARALGGTPAEARANAGELFGTLAARFGPVQLEQRYASVRRKIAGHALVPSPLWNDRTVWTSSAQGARELVIEGHEAPGAYLMYINPAAAAPDAPGDYRRTTHLRQLQKDVYEWQVHDELAIGDIDASDFDRALTAIFHGASGASESAIRASYRAALPRTTATLGELFTLEEIRSRATPDGATDLALVVRMHPEGVARTAPDYAKFLNKYVKPAELRLALSDATGARWWDVLGHDMRFTAHLRVKDGHLVPLEGAPREMPRELTLTADVTTKFGIFTVGVRHLVGHVTRPAAPHQLAFEVRFTKEPDWVLPPLAETLLNAPLERPFSGNGLPLRYVLRDGARPGDATVVRRDYDITVEESTVLRWLQKMGGGAVSEFRRAAEAQSDRYTQRVLQALQADALAVLQGTAASGAEGGERR
ncbi:MAG TPA: hypothetical protein VFK13_10350 [Gemmatimonadaceae bacterium]|nr:hypothetical protein [Gemmatimonadaceae bacterium]